MNNSQRQVAGALKRIPRVALLVESSRFCGRGLLRGIAQYARLHGPWSFFTFERELRSGVPAWLNLWKGDGVIARIEDQRMAAQLRKLGCPVIDLLGHEEFGDIPLLDTDAKAVGQVAADFFLQAGFQHFAFSGFKGLPFSERRGAAFVDYLAAKGKRVNQVPCRQNHSTLADIQTVEQGGIGTEKEIARWLKHQPRPMAVFACNDVRAQQVLNACRENRIRVPEDVAVMGVDNDDVLCSLCDPPLTSIELDNERLGFEAAALLARALEGARLTNTKILIPPARLVERSSTDVAAMDDPVVVDAIRYIRNNIAAGIAVKDVLSHVSRSRTDLEQRFRRLLGTSVASAILSRRLDRVRLLLCETKLTLGEVARQSGFTAASHLCHLFQRRFRQTPTEFRAGQKTIPSA